MAQQVISSGRPPIVWSDVDTAFDKINQNFTELYFSIGGSAVDLLNISSSLVPDLDISRDLGSANKRWRDLFLSGSSIYLGNGVITADLSGAINLPLNSTVGGNLIRNPQESSFRTISIAGQSNIIADNFQGQLNFSGSGISFNTDPSTDTITFVNSGVTSLLSGPGISVSSNTGNITVSNAGVREIIPGIGISVTSSTGNVTLTNNGVVTLLAGTGIAVDLGVQGTYTVRNIAPYIPPSFFGTISAPTQTNIVAAAPNSTLNLVGNGLSITNNAGTNTITFTVDQQNDLKGSVFADDSTLLVDAVAGKIVGAIDTASLRTSSLNIALGFQAGATNQAGTAIAIGLSSGQLNQGVNTVAIGGQAGSTNQGISAIAIGGLAGNTGQGVSCVALGTLSGQSNQGAAATAVGTLSGTTNQGQFAVAIGANSGGTNQGEAAIAIGYLSGNANQHANSIILNATGTGFTSSAAGFFVNPVRNTDGGAFLNYNSSTKEIGWSNDIRSENAINIDINLSDSTLRRWRFGEDGELTLPDGSVLSNYVDDRIVIDGVITFGGSGIDYDASEFKFVSNNQGNPLNAVRNIVTTRLIENKTTAADFDVTAVLDPITESPVFCDLTLTRLSDTSQVWQYRVAHIGRDTLDNDYRTFSGRFINNWSGDSAVIRVVITNNGGIASNLGNYDPAQSEEDWIVSGGLGSTILAFTIADSTRSIPRDTAQIGNFLKAVVDNVIYDGATEITDAETLRDRFYANIDDLVEAIGGNLYYDFEFYDSTRAFGSVPLTSATSTVNAQLSFNARIWGRYENPTIPIAGQGFQAGQVITLLGSSLDQYSVHPADQKDGIHDLTVTVTEVDGSGGITAVTISGFGIARWRTNSIGDGGDDQYDTANRYNTDLLNTVYESDGSTQNQDFLAYNNGFVTADDRAADAFGAGSKYVIAYHKGIVGLFATGCVNVAWFSMEGNSGRDGSGTSIQGPILFPRSFEFDVKCVSGPAYIPAEDEKFSIVLRKTQQQSLLRVHHTYDNGLQNRISDDTYLSSQGGGDFYVVGNDRLFLTANRDTYLRSGAGVPGNLTARSGKTIYIEAGDGLDTRAASLLNLRDAGAGGDVSISSGTGGKSLISDPIVSITRGYPTVVTLTNPVGNGGFIKFLNMVGMTELNDDIYTVNKTGDKEVELEVDSTGFGAFVSGQATVGELSGDIFISTLDNNDQFHGLLALNNYIWPSDPFAATTGQVLRVKTGNSAYPTLEFSNDFTASVAIVARNIESESDVSIRVNLTDSTTRIWQFGEDGNTEFPGSITALGTITGNILKIEDGVHEKFQTKADATGTVTHDCSAGHVFYHTSPDANWTANFTNLNLDSGYATTVTLIVVQGGTAYIPNSIQIGGISQTINWQGSSPPSGNANKTDIIAFSIINNSGTYTVFGQLTSFGI